MLIDDLELLAELHIAVQDAGSVDRWCWALGIERSLVYEIIAGTRTFTPQVASALGYKRAGGKWQSINDV